jgi:hypothetical protein
MVDISRRPISVFAIVIEQCSVGTGVYHTIPISVAIVIEQCSVGTGVYHTDCRLLLVLIGRVMCTHTGSVYPTGRGVCVRSPRGTTNTRQTASHISQSETDISQSETDISQSETDISQSETVCAKINIQFSHACCMGVHT